MYKYKRGLLYGRFQPFHNGHLYLIKQALKQVKNLTIGIGSANIHDENNPLTFEQRKKIVEEVVVKEGVDKIINIVPLNDYYDDELWFKNTINKTGKLDVVIGNNNWTNNIFVNNNIFVLRIKYYKRILYEGLKIRELIKKKHSWQKRIPQYLVSTLTKYLKTIDRIPYRFDHVALGGTFDHFHIGHIKLLDTAFKYAKNVAIGITDDKFCKNKFLSDSIEDFQSRKQNVIKYLKEKKLEKRSVIHRLNDIYGPTLKDGTFEALVVSKQTFANTVKINSERKKLNLPQLDNILVPDVLGEGKKLVSSERIRAGEIDRNGKSYMSIFKNKPLLTLPNNMRKELRKPIGAVIKGGVSNLNEPAKLMVKYINKNNPILIISVGDIVSQSLIQEGIVPDVRIIDYRSRRRIINKVVSQKSLFTKTINKPGTIFSEAAFKIFNAINHVLANKEKSTIIVDGEEDLLALPSILIAPLNSLIIYGQFDLGIVYVYITEQKKKETIGILNKFS